MTKINCSREAAVMCVQAALGADQPVLGITMSEVNAIYTFPNYAAGVAEELGVPSLDELQILAWCERHVTLRGFVIPARPETPPTAN